MDWDIQTKREAKIQIFVALLIAIPLAIYTWINNDAIVLSFLKFVNLKSGTPITASTIRKYIIFIRVFPYSALAMGLSYAYTTYHYYVGKNAKEKYIQSSLVDTLDLAMYISKSRKSRNSASDS